jgi:hypothetical protein
LLFLSESAGDLIGRSTFASEMDLRPYRVLLHPQFTSAGSAFPNDYALDRLFGWASGVRGGRHFERRQGVSKALYFGLGSLIDVQEREGAGCVDAAVDYGPAGERFKLHSIDRMRIFRDYQDPAADDLVKREPSAVAALNAQAPGSAKSGSRSGD